MEENIRSVITKATGASGLEEAGLVQRLWSGYGSIVRYTLRGADVPSVIVKHVSPPDVASHPRGWDTDTSHRRKLKSYAVETAWYRDYARQCSQDCRVPQCLAVIAEGDEVVLVLEDLDAVGFPGRRTEVSERELAACLKWLATFHASFMGAAADGLWASGSYWHLETRPDELKVLKGEDPQLHAAAEAIDRKLKAGPFQTLVHGDAKLANFCFSADGKSVAAVDFQYVGAGCGMKDLAYFVGSCLDEDACERHEARLLDRYFACLREALATQAKAVDADAVEKSWRALYPVAWTDFHRFLKGWSPAHWKIHSYSERLAGEVVARIKET